MDKIEDLYEQYRSTDMSDLVNRDLVWQQIDSISGEAAKFCIANEYDKMLSGIGAKGTNAYTSNDETYYYEIFPSNKFCEFLLAPTLIMPLPFVT